MNGPSMWPWTALETCSSATPKTTACAATPCHGENRPRRRIAAESGTTIGDIWLKTRLSRPHGVRIGPGGLLSVADTYNDRVLRGEYR